MLAEPAVRHVRALFISDVHLGTRGCQAELLLDFLRGHEADTIYLKRARTWRTAGSASMNYPNSSRQ